MGRILALLVVAIALSACATAKSDYALMWDSQSAQLYVFAPDGSQVPALGKQLVSVPGYIFSQGAIGMHPGEAIIGYYCPQPDGMIVLDAMPSVRYTFEAGHVYELRCKDGAPVITERRKGA